MKAAVIEKPGVLTVREVPEPVPGDYDCLCEMLYGATCTGTDQHMIAGQLPFPIDYPTIMGHESVGRVIHVGPKVRSFHEGDLVSRVGHLGDETNGLSSNWGGFAEYGLARDHVAMREDGLPKAEYDWFRTNQVIPPDIDPRAATLIITWRETLSYLTRLGVERGSRILVLGSGGNGLSFINHAHNRGAKSVMMIGSAGRIAEGKAAGANEFFDYKREDLGDAVRNEHPEPFDFIVDSVGKIGQINRVLELLAPAGHIGVYGIDDIDTYGINPFKASGSFTVYNNGYDEEEAHDAVIRDVQSGRLDASIWLDLENSYTLSEIGRAFDDLKDRKSVKALIDLRVS